MNSITGFTYVGCCRLRNGYTTERTKISSVDRSKSAMPFVLWSHCSSYMIIICSLFCLCFVLFLLELSQSKEYLCSLFRIELGLLHYQDGLFALCIVHRTKCSLQTICLEMSFLSLPFRTCPRTTNCLNALCTLWFLRTISLIKVYSIR